MEGGPEVGNAGTGNNDVDERTIFVRSLPYTVNDAQLEDYFGEVGPVRNCFTVKQKGAEQHRGFGFVHFAVKEDAIRAVEVKNGASLQGRKIKVELAKRRAPLDTRHPKGKRKDSEGTAEGDGGVVINEALTSEPKDKESRKRKAVDIGNDPPNVELSPGAVARKIKGKTPAVKVLPKDTKKRPREEGKASEAQRPARTVVIGCLENPKMVEAAIAKAKKLGTVEDVRNSVPEAELISRGLAKDGCKGEAVEIVYSSVKAACQAVAALHRQNVGGRGAIWARQLGGEGAKLKKWRLIVRNLPFMLKEQTLRQLFSSSGFVWEITIPRKPDNSSKGFAFVGFTCKADAEKAIKAVNGTVVSKRPIAVDWAMAKREFEAVVAKTSPLEADDDDTASEDDSDEGSDDDENGDGSDSDEDTKLTVKASKKLKVDGDFQKPGKRIADLDIASSDDDEDEDEDEDEEDNEDEENSSKEEGLDYSTEKDLAKRVLERVMASSKEQELDEPDVVEMDLKQIGKRKVSSKDTKASVKEVKKPEVAEPSKKGKKGKSVPETSQEVKQIANQKVSPKDTKAVVKETTVTKTKASVKDVKKPEIAETSKNNKKADPVAKIPQEDSLNRTVFVRNLPLEAKVQDLRRQFSDFGEVKSFRLVFHPITKRPKGTAFVEFVTGGGAQEAVSAASRSESDGGLVVGGRKITMDLALDRDQAKQVARQMSREQDDHDRRHLKLAKEGLIEEGTPAARGLSKGDLMKRKQIEHEKSTKLRSPNFHVSTTRLAVHNVPKEMTEKELKRLFIEAVKSRASKQQPVLKQVKILRDEVKGVPGSGGKSRGAAFVEFTEHQHALVGLRVLNNNPETFGPEHRPIIEFAIENSQKLKLRATREALAKGRQAKAAKDGFGRDGDGSNKKAKKWESKNGEESSAKDVARTPNDSNHEGNQPGKRKREKNKKNKNTVDQKTEAVVSKEGTESKVSRGEAWKPNKKRQKLEEGNPGKRNRDNKISSDQTKSSKTTPDKSRGANVTRVTPQSGKEVQSKKPSSGIAQEKATPEKTRRGKKQPEVADKLDHLVAEYRSKYFNTPTGSKAKGDADLKRWFE